MKYNVNISSLLYVWFMENQLTDEIQCKLPFSFSLKHWHISKTVYALYSPYEQLPFLSCLVCIQDDTGFSFTFTVQFSALLIMGAGVWWYRERVSSAACFDLVFKRNKSKKFLHENGFHVMFLSANNEIKFLTRDIC